MKKIEIETINDDEFTQKMIDEALAEVEAAVDSGEFTVVYDSSKTNHPFRRELVSVSA